MSRGLSMYCLEAGVPRTWRYSDYAKISFVQWPRLPNRSWCVQAFVCAVVAFAMPGLPPAANTDHRRWGTKGQRRENESVSYQMTTAACLTESSYDDYMACRFFAPRGCCDARRTE